MRFKTDFIETIYIRYNNTKGANKAMVKRIGITGAIGTGKSTVGRLLEAQGYPVIDADEVVHQALAENTAVHHALREQMGNELFDQRTGQPSRPALAKRIFHYPAEKAFLEGLLHPIVRQEIERFFTQYQAKDLAFALVPLLFESGLEPFYDEVWCVACSPAIQVSRLKVNRGMTDEQIQARLSNQWALDEKIKRSDRVLWNDGSLQALQTQVEQALSNTIK
jgi:dephospho-CoA kinase